MHRAGPPTEAKMSTFAADPRLTRTGFAFGEEERPKSWFTQVIKVARKYGIDAIKVLADPWPKEAWKSKIKNAISSFWKVFL